MPKHSTMESLVEKICKRMVPENGTLKVVPKIGTAIIKRRATIQEWQRYGDEMANTIDVCWFAEDGGMTITVYDFDFDRNGSKVFECHIKDWQHAAHGEWSEKIIERVAVFRFHKELKRGW